MSDDHAHLRDYLANRDFPCPACGYNLRGPSSDRCPECNLELVLTVRLAEPRLGVFIAELVGLACGAGFSGLLLVYAIIQISVSNFGLPNNLEFLAVTGLPLVIEGALLIAWVRMRGAIRRLSSPTQVGLVIGTWALTVANLVVFTCNVR